jgi:hypothetical protein
MSDEPMKSGGKRWGCAALVLVPIGAVIGYFVGVDYFCQSPKFAFQTPPRP